MATVGHAPAFIHSDNGKEFVSSAVMAAERMAGTATTTTTPHNPEGNCITENINRTLMNGTRCILRTVHIPWPYRLYSVRDVAGLNRACSCMKSRENVRTTSGTASKSAFPACRHSANSATYPGSLPEQIWTTKARWCEMWVFTISIIWYSNIKTAQTT